MLPKKQLHYYCTLLLTFVSSSGCWTCWSEPKLKVGDFLTLVRILVMLMQVHQLITAQVLFSYASGLFFPAVLYTADKEKFAPSDYDSSWSNASRQIMILFNIQVCNLNNMQWLSYQVLHPRHVLCSWEFNSCKTSSVIELSSSSKN